MTSSLKVDILLATYNGEKFLREQLNSILNQTYSNWRLIVNDDGSSDNTLDILRYYVSQFPTKIQLIEGSKTRLGVKHNFAKLLEYANEDYIMFCDQDDVWLPMKIAETVSAMQALAEKHGKDVPLMVFTDLKVVDEDLNLLCDSFWRYQCINPGKKRLNNGLLVQNVVAGCTVMINQKLKELSKPMPEEALMHDWWLALTAAAFGKIECLNFPTILYRQHGLNNTGAREWGVNYILKNVMSFKERKQNFLAVQHQAKIFLAYFGSRLDKETLNIVRILADLREHGFIRRRYYFFRYKFYKSGYIRNLGTFICM